MPINWLYPCRRFRVVVQPPQNSSFGSGPTSLRREARRSLFGMWDFADPLRLAELSGDTAFSFDNRVTLPDVGRT